ncbi:glycosyltransferase family 4 protein [Microbacterium hominis]|uniref:Glycosyltransferase subfamily 4-like N-terminal domain-containing protein n=1 Tax=Microbacterium hominis TaxID=162426 RepID=A0A0B4CYA6_9MICO|nr:glycosyltransferase family 4 protein [Microbacterium hominis]KIC59371.1 hypothetical protein RM52_04010 [Microbacterium hominis]
MRITVLSVHYAPEPSGNAPYVADLCAGLATAGHDVTVITAHPFYPQWKRYSGYGPGRSEERHDGVTVIRRKHFIPRRLNPVTRLLGELSAGWAALREGLHDPDAVILVSPALFHAAVASAPLRWGRTAKHIPWLLWVQDLYSLGAKETGLRGVGGVLSYVESRLLRAATRVVSIHDRFTDVITTRFAIEPSKVSTIRNWTHLVSRADVTPKGSTPRWTDEKFVVLHAGNQGVKQGLENVIRAAILAEDRDLPLRFVLLGDGNQRARLEQLANGCSRVDFVDPLSDADFQEAMASAGALLVNELPSLREMSVPSKLTSYFAAGRPVLAATAADSVTAQEVLRAGGGIVVDGGDPEALLKAALRLHGDPELRRELGRAGLQYRDTVLGRDVAIEQFCHVIEKAARQSAGSQ